MSNNRKILIYVSETLPTNAGDGKSAFTFAKALQKQNVSVEILTLNKNKSFSPKENIEGIKIIRIPYYNKSFIQKFISRIITIPYFLKYASKNKMILIYGGVMNHRALIFTSKLLGKKVIFRSTLLEYDDFKTLLDVSTLKRFYRKFIYGLLNGYFSINKVFSARFTEQFNGSISIFESIQGVDLSTFKAVNQEKKSDLRKSFNLPENKLIIISVGFLIHRKGYKEVFETLEQINQDFLYIVAGNYKDENNYYSSSIRQEMNELHSIGVNKLKNKIIFLGSVQNVNEYLQCADIFLHNSFQEGTPNVLLEAMACGIASVVRKLDGITDQIIEHEKDGYIFENSEKMKAHIQQLIADNDLRSELGEKACIKAGNMFNINEVAIEFMDKFYSL